MDGTDNSQYATPEIVERRATPGEREKLILEYAPLVKRVAYRIVARLPDSIQVEDLISIGTIGLIDAVEKYNPDKGKSFRAYAELRIKGMILDELRGIDNLSRANRRRANEMEQARKDFEQTYGRAPSNAELAEELGIDIDDMHSLRSNTRTLVFLDIDDETYGSSTNHEIYQTGQESGTEEFEAFKRLADSALRDQLAEAIENLPEKLRLVLSLYYYSELNYKEIGEVLALSESRISQLHSKAILKLKKALKNMDAA